jgi:hypothetical protein
MKLNNKLPHQKPTFYKKISMIKIQLEKVRTNLKLNMKNQSILNKLLNNPNNYYNFFIKCEQLRCEL